MVLLARLLLLLSLPLAAVLVGPWLEPRQTFPSGPVDRSALRSAPLPVLWLGDRYRGLALTAVARDDGSVDEAGLPARAVTLVYGACTTRGESCTPPLTVHLSTACARASPARLVAGVPAGWRGDVLELAGALVTVTISGRSRKEAVTAARALRPANARARRAARPEAPLGPPAARPERGAP